MELQYEAPRHANGAFPCCQLRAVNEVEIPKEVAEEKGCCEAVNVVFTSGQSTMRPSIPVPKMESHLSIRLSSALETLWLINALVWRATSKMRSRNVSSCTTCSSMMLWYNVSMLIEVIRRIAKFRENFWPFPKVTARWRQHAVAICMDVSSAEWQASVSSWSAAERENMSITQLTQLCVVLHQAMEDSRAESN